MEEIEKGIMKLLGVNKWTIRCMRVYTYMKEANDFDVSHYAVYHSGDYKWMFRRNRPKEWMIWRIGADGDGYVYRSYVYLVKEV